MPNFDPRVGHLLRRATLGPTIEEIQAASAAGLHDTLDQMLATFDRPLGEEEAAADAIGGVFLKDAKGLRAGWMLRLLHNPNLFREKLTLFWHNHFATAVSKVEDPPAMAAQVETLRRSALGGFREMLLAVATDPAMLVWLDNALNVSGHPNENFARELMELFTLGRGNYTERDVQEVARAFTGWNLRDRRFAFFPERHDAGPKTVLGKAGNLDGGEVLDLLARHPGTARFLSWKLWKFFVSQDPTDKDLAPLARAYQDGGGRIAPVVRAMFASPRFFSPDVVGRQVKSPVEYVVGVVRALRAEPRPQLYADAAAAMGQELYNPPDVSGWAGGENWISTFTLLERIRLARQLAGQGRPGFVCGLDIGAIVSENFIGDNEELVGHFATRLLHRPASAKLRGASLDFLAAGARGTAAIKLPTDVRDEKVRGLVRLILCSPEYQLC